MNQRQLKPLDAGARSGRLADPKPREARHD